MKKKFLLIEKTKLLFAEEMVTLISNSLVTILGEGSMVQLLDPEFWRKTVRAQSPLQNVLTQIRRNAFTFFRSRVPVKRHHTTTSTIRQL